MPFKDPVYKRPCFYLVLAVFVLSMLLYAKNFVIDEGLMNVPEKSLGLLVGLGVIAFALLAARFFHVHDRNSE
jgi:hypothetical protein